ncbi:hypothetical protein COOONC_04881 [Cooperia oncophora]
MHILPTKMGYLVSGKPKIENNYAFQVSQPLPDDEDPMGSALVDGHNTTMSSLSESDISHKEKDKWDPRWDTHLNRSLDAIYTSRRTKEIFQDLDMNVRKFSSSNHLLILDGIEYIDETDENSAEVLGLSWECEGRHDCITSCHVPDTPSLTKKSITIAAIGIPEVVQVFTQKIPRFRASRNTQVFLLPSQMALRQSYLCQHDKASLIMAGSKLPPLHGQHTIPEAGTKCCNFVHETLPPCLYQLKDTLSIQGIYLFSDAEIVLSWLKRETRT